MFITSSLYIKYTNNVIPKKIYCINISRTNGRFKSSILFDSKRHITKLTQNNLNEKQITKKKKFIDEESLLSETQVENNTQSQDRVYSNDVTIKFNGALFDALQSGNLMMAERIWNLICKKNLQKTIFTYRYGIKLMTLLGKLKEAKEYAYEAIKLFPSNPSLFSIIIEYYCKENNIKDVLQIYNNLKNQNIILDSKSICNIINLLAVNKLYFHGIKIFRDYDEVNKKRVAMIVYNSIFRCFIELKRYDEAIEVYKQMKLKVPKNSIRYSLETIKFICFIEAFLGNYSKIIKYFKHIKENYGGINTDHLLYALRAFYHKRDKESFVSILKYAHKYMVVHGHSVSYLRLNMALLNEFIKNKELEFTEILYETAQFLSEEYDIDLQPFYPKLAKVYLECGYENKALLLFEKFKLASNEDSDEDISTAFFYYYMKSKNLEKAKFYLKFLPEKEIPIAQLHVLCESENLEQAYNYFRDTFLDDQKDKKIVLNAFHILFTSYINSDKPEEAEKLYYSVKLFDLEPNLTTIYYSLQLIMKTKSLETFIKNYENIKASHYFSPNIRIFNTVIEAYVKHNKYEEAQRFFLDNFAPNGILPNEYTFPLIKATITENTDDKIFKELEDQFKMAGMKLERSNG